MLSPNTLARAPLAYQRGYRDGYNGEVSAAESHIGVFAHYDYSEGYAAGQNDRKWEDAQ